MEKMIRLLHFLSVFIEDFFILVGSILIVIATFMFSKVAGIYILGFICLVIGLFLARKPPRKE